MNCKWKFEISSGYIPIRIGNLKSLTLFFAWWNRLIGSIPNNRSECQELQPLDLPYNSLFAPILKQIFALTNLTKVLLLSNNFSGFIPPDTGNCTNLYMLRLSGSRLLDTIPSEIGSLKSLNSFMTSDTKFSFFESWEKIGLNPF